MAHIYSLIDLDKGFSLTKAERRALRRVVEQLHDVHLAEAVFGHSEPQSVIECEAMAKYNEFVGNHHPDPHTKSSYLNRAKDLREQVKAARSRAQQHTADVSMRGFH